MRRPLRNLLIVVVAGLPLVVTAAADLVAVPVIEARLEDRVRSATRAASVQSEIGSFPVVGRAVAIGEVASVDVTWYGVAVGAIEATSLEFHLDGVGFDRGELLGGSVRITGVESGEVRMLISPSQLTRLFERDVLIEGGRVRVRTGPETAVDVEASATAQRLVLTAAGLPPITAEIGTDQFPCAPAASVDAGNLLLRCSFRGLPALLRQT